MYVVIERSEFVSGVPVWVQEDEASHRSSLLDAPQGTTSGSVVGIGPPPRREENHITRARAQAMPNWSASLLFVTWAFEEDGFERPDFHRVG
jgi:hypothetical protein